MTNDLYAAILQALAEVGTSAKCQQVQQLAQDWSQRTLLRLGNGPVQDIDDPGRPHYPLLVDPREVPRRSLASEQGRVVMLHAFAHIEFNAINLALDAAYRFRDMPDDFISDWLQVAVEEAYHFTLIADYLNDLGSHYGAYNAHNGLWDMACKTRHDVLHRMALVPRVMEARGLDVTPGLMQKFAQIGDQRMVDILQIIYQEEVGHVAIGNRWYHYCCEQRGLDASATFKGLIDEYFSGNLRGPFNHAARLKAGFDEDELKQLENCL